MFTPLPPITLDNFLLLDAAQHEAALASHQLRIQQLETALSTTSEFADGEALSQALGHTRSLYKLHAQRLQELRTVRLHDALLDGFRQLAA